MIARVGLSIASIAISDGDNFGRALQNELYMLLRSGLQPSFFIEGFDRNEGKILAVGV